ncbi:hypothetical protein F4802DRAFT_561870 [Xylaria palmicola]|nr:hypothetical protein F4802DRAFT_561870 [Xylaria palmicola]
MRDDIAIVGLSFKLPQDAVDELSFWDALQHRKNFMTEWPESRLNVDAFYSNGPAAYNKLKSRGGHFLKQDPMAFDAPFFSITAKEAAAMDPQHRICLEESYRAFENAGMPLETLKGSCTAVFAASMTDDYTRMLAMDPDRVPSMAILGTASSMLPNRLSWYFDLTGPSVHVDTACSSSMVALDLACQSLYSHSASMALVVGANMMLGPGCSVLLSNGNFLSPESRCYSFDRRANGYARGEGIISIIIKRATDAIRDGDTIRAVIRSIGSNQDGRTPILTQPSADAQERLMRHVYHKAGLGFARTRYFEAHGTGTSVGDPVEAEAIGRVFGQYRSSTEPLYIGSVKGNIGHLEGSSGLAGVVKAMLVLEKGIIPPNAGFKTINPNIDTAFYNIKVPTEEVAWPVDGLRRASVNSFGFGGTNSHVIMDDAFHYLQTHGLQGNHRTLSSPHPATRSPVLDGQVFRVVNGITNGRIVSGTSGPTTETHGSSVFSNGKSVIMATTNGQQPDQDGKEVALSEAFSRLLVWTAPNEKSLERVIRGYENYYEERIFGCQTSLDQLSFTMATRRSHLLWRTFAVVGEKTAEGGVVEENIPRLLTAKPLRASSAVKLAFVFTGQGAQYTKMGIELTQYSNFKQTLQRIDSIFASLGSTWSVFDELSNGHHIDGPDRSQPLCSALQIALVDLLKSFGIRPIAVVGHSSGEIAAAYSIGALSLESACKVAYYRGTLAAQLQRLAPSGAMLSVNLAASQLKACLENMCSSAVLGSIEIACVNSPVNLTLSGSEESIDNLKEHLDSEGIFARKLNTGVAYHSRSMLSIAAEYHELLGSLTEGNLEEPTIPMVSSVTGNNVTSVSLLSKAQYWVDNLISPVQFSKALGVLARDLNLPTTDLIEVGPHPALRRPILDTLARLPNDGIKEIRYNHTLYRNTCALQTTQKLAGHLFSLGYPVCIATVNQHLPDGKGPVPIRVDCPEYPFDNSHKYSAETQLSRDFRLRGHVPHELGTRSYDWNPLRPKWRKFLDTESIPWTGDHVVNGTVLYPATGMIVMALEAVKQSCPQNRQFSGYLIKEASFLNPILVGRTWEESTETIIELQREDSLEFNIGISALTSGRWTNCFSARIQAQPEDKVVTEVDGGLETRLRNEQILRHFQDASRVCSKSINRQAFYGYCQESGLHYGKQFRLLDDIHWDGSHLAMATANTSDNEHQTTSLVHPALLDCALQLLFTQATKGLTELIPTTVPVKLTDAWISATGWEAQRASPVQILTCHTPKPGSKNLEGAVHILGSNGSPICAFRKATLAPIASEQIIENTKPRLLYSIDWKPHSSLLSRSQMSRLCEANHIQKDETLMEKYRELLDDTLGKIVRKTVKQLTAKESAVSNSLDKHLDWMRHYVESNFGPHSPDQDASDQKLSASLDALEELYPPWAVVPAVARDLPQILSGTKDALDVVYGSGLAERLYYDVCDSVCDDRFRTLLDLLAHENPNLRILEVGAGTGGMTRHVLSALREFEEQKGGSWFAEYTYTDLSPVFFEKASEKFGRLGGDKLQFKQLDLERDLTEQGFSEGAYDLVIAGSVFHATTDLVKTLQNVGKVMKPGGRLVCLEVVTPENVTPNFAFGVLPGWWLFNDKLRTLHPAITEQQWDELFRQNGFSGNDLVLRDYQTGSSHIFSILVSTREVVLNENRSKNVSRIYIIVQATTEQKVPEQVLTLARLLCAMLHPQETATVSLGGLNEITLTDSDVVISLVEIVTPFLSTISDHWFASLKTLMKRVKNLLWVSSARLEDAQYPQHCMVQGFLRSIRSENIDKRIITLILEMELVQLQAIQSCIEQLVKIYNSAFEAMSPELEYIFRDGQLRTARLVEEVSLDDTLRQLVEPQSRSEPLQPGPPVKLAIKTLGFLDTLDFVEDTAGRAELGPDEVEIETQAWGLSFRDVLLALGRFEGDFGFDYAGIVTRTGPICGLRLRPGDRVCGIAPGCMRTHIRAPAVTVIKIADSVSFEAAASVLSPGVTAYYSLVHAARLRKGEKILIHAGSGSTGQMAIHIAKSIGAEVFATVGFEEKKHLLMTEFGIPEDHIFYSRNTTFAQGIMRMTNGHGVDVLVNSLSGEGLRASWECMAPYGRFVELGKADIMANASLSMAGFSRNVSFLAVDLLHIAQSDPDLTGKLATSTIDLITQDSKFCPAPIHVYPVADVEPAFRYLQSGKSTGRIVVEVNHSTTVRRRLLKRCDWTLDPSASYVIAGGFGGLGRAITRWMAKKGAKNLILLSRSGSASKETARAVVELQEQGIHVAAPKCDVSSAQMLSNALEECTLEGMPPVKGCINAAMVLQDAVFDNMTHAQWDLTVRSKVQTSLNLHKALPRSLDFFVLLSSLAGIHGSIAQSNYAAGCSAQDALARHRVACGLKGVAFDLGWMRDIGIIAEVAAYQVQRRNAADMAQIDAVELMALLDLYCDPARPMPSIERAQLMVGVVTPARRIAQGQSAPELTRRPLFAGFADGPGLAVTPHSRDGAMEDIVTDGAVMFRLADATEARADIVTRVLAARLARALGIAADDIERAKQLSDYGVDSLMAVELRNWLAKDFGANIAVFDITSGASIEMIGHLVVTSSDIV